MSYLSGSHRCENCSSLFFKILETRVSCEHEAVFYKKRCKRCKYKCLIRKAIPHGKISVASRQEWLMATKIATPVLPAGKVCERPKILAGEYTQRISHSADTVSLYLAEIRRAEHMEDTQA